jgi:hypothetical protein
MQSAIWPIFSRNDSIDKIAFVNWRISQNDGIRNFLIMADGFMTSALELTNKCLEDNRDKKADILIFPILTNVNHGIELYLKAMLWTLNTIMQSGEKIERGHNIKQLYETVRSKIKSYNGKITLKGFNAETKNLRTYIEELYEKTQGTNKDDKMDFARYPFGNDYENHFYVTDEGNVEIDLENFAVRFKAIHETFEQLSSFLFYQELLQA